MKYFTKIAKWSEMVEKEINLTSERYQNNDALVKLMSALREIEVRKPLAPHKNPNPTISYLLR